ncbi:hypothetical protein ST37_19080 [Vibrio sp. qd031]|uniref:GspE/PulE family protein n=1 Tax=Vibrio sp. qd031 TaxID=1603038 RepID=UPI000A10D0CB|nr:ATPase, T2SS/T4P/T4SS family [Vibrio sp. qd031]ORT48314.1 hypothetical protein ST37_19080 [Vibrio sp. qd031]
MTYSQLPLLLHSEGYLSAEGLQRYERQSNQSQRSPHQRHCELLKVADISDDNLCHLIADRLSYPTVELSLVDRKQFTQWCELADLCLEHLAIPILYKNGNICIAAVDPTLKEIEQNYQFALQQPVQVGVCTLKSLAQCYQTAFERPLNVSLDSVGLTATQKPMTSHAQLTNRDDQSPVSQYITHLLLDAHQQGCSDIHFEPYQSRFRIRYRVDGMLRDVPNPAQTITARLISRLKIMANLDIAQQRVPQDGRIAIELAEKVNAEYRVSTLPTLWGEKVVLRSTQTQTPLQLTQLGLNVQQVQVLKDALTKPQGMILITGPTGSGKTQTLYAALRFLNQSHRNISTAEDPIEMQLDGINQLQLHSGVGLDYHQALRAFLRQDPDVIMIGEIRDNDTALAAIKASQTGHLLLSTLHTNSALETITRLVNLGIKPYNLAASLSVIIAQRLLRLLCTECKQPQVMNQQMREILNHADADATTLFQANPMGCSHCHLGYKGRIAIFEFLLVDASIKRELLSTQHLLPGEAVIEQACISTLMSSGLELIAKGLTSYSELKRIVSEY